MPSVKDIIEIIENTAPLDLQYSWDNSGFLCGSVTKEVKKLYLTLDVNMYTVDEAVRTGADMILSHHPILFRGANNINYNTPQGYVLKELVKNDIALYASHTPTDCANGGINDALADKLGIINKKIIEINDKYDGCGLGRCGDLESAVTLMEFAQRVKLALKTPFVRVCGDLETIIKKAAVGGGACDELIPAAKALGADVMVTADMKYHIAMEGVESGICVIDAGHYPTENFVIEIFEGMLKNTDIEIIRSTETDVFKYI
ncbi:MAG: Nif3-like dinuclear metal center hexameric protein [Candidatus Ornithomonoglobus sp.]